jgi:hypothetical protein
MSYNGWSNYQTWNVKLWIDNEQADYGYWQERVEQLVEESKENETEVDIYELSQELESYYDMIMEETIRLPMASMFTDIMGEAWGQVDWYEIAANMLSDYELG